MAICKLVFMFTFSFICCIIKICLLTNCRNGGKNMAKDEFRIMISEKEPQVMQCIITALNSLASEEGNGFRFEYENSLKIFNIFVYRCRNSYPSFKVAFKSEKVDEKVFALNALFRKCKVWFTSASDSIIITIGKQYKVVEELNSFNFRSNTISQIVSFRKSFPAVRSIIQVLNKVRILKMLTIDHNHILTISAIGHDIALSLKVTINHSQAGSELASFCSKFNFISAMGLADYIFEIIKLTPDMPEMLQCTVFIPDDPEKQKKFDSIITLINTISAD